MLSREGMDLLQQAVAIFAVFGFLGAGLWVLNRRGLASFGVRSGATRRMQLIERLPLTAQHSLHLVRVEGRLMLVASSPGGCTVLNSVQACEEAGQ